MHRNPRSDYGAADDAEEDDTERDHMVSYEEAPDADETAAELDGFRRLLPKDPYIMYLSISPQSHASVTVRMPVFAASQSPTYKMWTRLPDKVDQVIMSMPNADSAVVSPLTTNCKSNIFGQVTTHDVKRNSGENPNTFLQRVIDSTRGMPKNEFVLYRKATDGSSTKPVPLEENMTVVDITNHILSPHGIAEKHFSPFGSEPNDERCKAAIKGYRDEPNVLNVIASWSIQRNAPPFEMIKKTVDGVEYLTHTWLLYIPIPVSSKGSLSTSETVEACIQQVIGITPGLTRDLATIKVAVHDFLCSDHYCIQPGAAAATTVRPLQTVVPRNTRKGGKKRLKRLKTKRLKRLKRLKRKV
jgi:hypothetical protein